MIKWFKRKFCRSNIYQFLDWKGNIVYICYDPVRAEQIMKEIVASAELLSSNTLLPGGWVERIYGYNLERGTYYVMRFREGE